MPGIEDLPIEIIWKIGDLLNPADLWNFAESSPYIKYIFANENLWERLSKKWFGDEFPMFMPKRGEFSWSKNTVKYFKDRYPWDREGASIVTHNAHIMHYGTLDSILMLEDGRHCVTGGRDKALALWDVKGLFSNRMSSLVHCQIHATRSWIWALIQLQNRVVSASFDKTVKMWDIGRGLEYIDTIEFNFPPVALTALTANEVCAGLQDGCHVYIDTRRNIPYFRCKMHQRVITDMKSQGNYIFSCGEDHAVTISDHRKLGRCVARFRGMITPLKISVCEYYLLVGNCKGDVLVYDASTFGLAAMIEDVVPRESKMTGLCHSMGNMVVSAANRTIKQYSLCTKPKVKHAVQIPYAPAAMDYKHQIIAIGTTAPTIVLITYSDHPIFA